MILKSNKTGHEEYKRKERESKRTTKLRKNVLINYHQQSEEPLGHSTFFSNAAIKSRSVKKAEKTLLKSPSRKREVITRLASKYQIRVKFGEKLKRNKYLLSEEEVDRVFAFLNQPDISYTIPDRKQNVYVGTFNKVRKFAQKRYLLWTMREILEIINGSKLLESSEGDNFCFKFGKDITFRQLYDVMKRHKAYIFNKKIPQWSWLREICENTLLRSMA